MDGEAPRKKREPSPIQGAGAAGTREKIKEVAQKLIAERGVDGISIRDIIAAAGQRNMASIHYYFRNKEELVRELLVDSAELMDRFRAAELLRFEEIGGRVSVRQLAHVLIPGAKLDPTTGGRNATVMRFIGTVAHTHRRLFIEAMEDSRSPTYQRVVDLIRRELSHIPLAVLNQRLLFFMTCCTSLLVAREDALTSEGHVKEYWSQPGTYLNMLDFMCAGLSAPVTGSEMNPPA